MILISVGEINKLMILVQRYTFSKYCFFYRFNYEKVASESNLARIPLKAFSPENVLMG